MLGVDARFKVDRQSNIDRVLKLHDVADATTGPDVEGPSAVLCMDEFGLLNLLPRPDEHWALAASKKSPTTPATKNRTR